MCQRGSHPAKRDLDRAQPTTRGGHEALEPDRCDEQDNGDPGKDM